MKTKGYNMKEEQPAIDRWFKAMERRTSYLGTQADFATHHSVEAKQAKANGTGVVANFWQNFGKISLVFGCIGADLCK